MHTVVLLKSSESSQTSPTAPVEAETKHVRPEHYTDVPCSSALGLLRAGARVRISVILDGKHAFILRSVL